MRVGAVLLVLLFAVVASERVLLSEVRASRLYREKKQKKAVGVETKVEEKEEGGFNEVIFAKGAPLALPHGKWEQKVIHPSGHVLMIDWRFHSRKSLQARLFPSLSSYVSSFPCEMVTWVVSYEGKTSGQVTCLWNMQEGNHCNQICQWPLIARYQYSGLDSLFKSFNESSLIVTYVVGNFTSGNLYEYTPYESESLTKRELRSFTSPTNEWSTLSRNKLVSNNGYSYENFGTSVSLSDGFAAVGAIGSKDKEGKVFIFERIGVSEWKQESTPLLGGDSFTNDFFGWSVSMYGDSVAVGAYQTVHTDQKQRVSVGAVYLFQRVSSGWTSDSFLQIVDNSKNNKDKNGKDQTLSYDNFGWSVSLYETTLAVGAYGDSTLGTSAGATYIFDRQSYSSLQSWSCSQKLLPSDGSEYDAFGWSVSLHQNFTVVGAYGHSSMDKVFNGAVYIFQRVSSSSSSSSEAVRSWTQTRILLPADGGNNDFFGWDVAVFDKIIAVGSHSWESQVTDDTPIGAVYTYSTNDKIKNLDDTINLQIKEWTFDEKLTPSDSSTRYFGNCIALYENNMLVGSFGDEYSVIDVGQAFLYTASSVQSSVDSSAVAIESTSDKWKKSVKLIPNTTESDIDFGFSVAIDGVTAAVGAVRADGNAVDSGGVFIFIKANTMFEYPLSERTYLALVSFLPIFFVSVFCIIGTTVLCMKLKTSTTFFTLMDDLNEDDYDDDLFNATQHSGSSMDSSVYSETELIRQDHRSHFIIHGKAK